MRNHSTASSKELDTIKLDFTPGKTFTLNGVYRVPEVTRNLVSGSILSKCGFKIKIAIFDYVTILKRGVLVDKRFVYDGMFKMNINRTIVSVYTIDSLNL